MAAASARSSGSAGSRSRSWSRARASPRWRATVALVRWARVEHKGEVAGGVGASGHWFGHQTDESVAVAGNMLTGAETLDAMLEKWRTSGDLPLGERLLNALEAGLAAGGDKRGHRSAALVGEEEYPTINLRIDDAEAPVEALRSLFSTAQDKLFPILARLPSRKNPIGSPPG